MLYQPATNPETCNFHVGEAWFKTFQLPSNFQHARELKIVKCKWRRVENKTNTALIGHSLLNEPIENGVALAYIRWRHLLNQTTTNSSIPNSRFSTILFDTIRRFLSYISDDYFIQCQ